MSLPGWRGDRFRKATGEDHLGILSVGISIANNLLPGINTVTPRARYFSFYSWVLNEFLRKGQDKSKEAFKQHLRQREFAYVLANIAVAEHDKTHIGSITGINKGMEVWKQGAKNIRVNEEYVQQALGGYAIYRGAMEIMHLIERQDDIRKVDKITNRGIAVAIEFEKSIQNTRYYKEFLAESEISRSVLLEYGIAGGLTKLEGKPDAEKLIFTLTRPDLVCKDMEVRRRETIAYILHVLSSSPDGRVLKASDWRMVLYKSMYPGEVRYSCLQELRYAQLGWRMYQLRQYFGYALETLMCHLIEELWVESISLSTFLDKKIFKDEVRFGDVKIVFDPDSKLADFIEQLPTLQEEECISAIGSSRMDALKWNDHFATPVSLLMMLYIQLNDLRSDEYCSMFAEMGGDTHISLAEFVGDVDGLLREDSTLGGFCRFVLDKYVVCQHHSTALGKILGYELETFRFVDNDGRLEAIDSYQPNFNQFRVEQLLQVMNDLGLIKINSDKVVVTELGQSTIQKVAQLSRLVEDRIWGEEFGSIQ